jgi:hypothetical protein
VPGRRVVQFVPSEAPIQQGLRSHRILVLVLVRHQPVVCGSDTRCVCVCSVCILQAGQRHGACAQKRYPEM